jgi:multidrug efflux system outer membrane protein
LLALSGCRVGPGYERPELPRHESFRTPAGDSLDAADKAWWTGFSDGVLDDLIAEALRENPDIRIAASRVEEFAARIGITRSAAFPQIDSDGSGGRAQQSREIGVGAAGGPRIADFFEANLNVGWELDVFGRIRRATDAAVADTIAAEEVRRGVILTLVSSVATSYIGLRSLDEQLAIARRVLDTRRETVRLFELQFEKGVISRLELAQIRSELERTAATIPALERDIAVLENALSVLLGRPPGPVMRGADLADLTPPVVPAGLPSELLLRRPDLRAAEQNLIAANARVGAAVADFYPRFALTGSLGLASSDLSDLLSSPATTYTLAAGLTAPIFTAGLLENRLAVAEAVERQALDAYRGAVLTALREAEDALVTRATTADEAEAQARQVAQLARSADLAMRRYDNGFVGFLDVLDAERTLFDAKLQQARLRASLLVSAVGIYKAFGGGWVAIAESISDAEIPSDPQTASESRAAPGEQPPM